MSAIKFTKMQGAGNDFVVVSSLVRLPFSPSKTLIQKLCDRKYGVGADGVLLIEKSKRADIRMRIFNADGTEAEMCGNGARCAAFFIRGQRTEDTGQKKITLETKAGIVESEVHGDSVKIKLTDPKDVKLDVPIKINGRNLKVNFINTGVPHVVVFVQVLKDLAVASIGREVRYHKHFAPRGANVNFVEVLSKNSIAVRTYERGVEDETLACGTGSVASALITRCKMQDAGHKTQDKIEVKTKSGEVLKVYFEKADKCFRNVWLEGKAQIVYTGEYHV